MNKITITNETLGKQFRSALNSFLHSNFIIAGDLDSLETAIEIEAMILAKGFIIQYEVDKGTRRIRRAKNIFRSNGRNKQRLTIKDVYGKRVLKKPEAVVETVLDSPIENKSKLTTEDFKGQYVFNVKTKDVGRIKYYNKGNSKNSKGEPIPIKMRFNLDYVYTDKNDNTLKIGDNTWDEKSCIVFKSPAELIEFVEMHRITLYKDDAYFVDEIINNLNKKLEILGERSSV